jgi:hypothetical protein
MVELTRSQFNLFKNKFPFTDGFLDVGKAQKLFNKIDDDGSGSLSYKEIKFGMREISPVLDVFLTQAIHLRAMKKASDSAIEINFEEFKVYIVWIYNYVDYWTQLKSLDPDYAENAIKKEVFMQLNFVKYLKIDREEVWENHVRGKDSDLGMLGKWLDYINTLIIEKPYYPEDHIEVRKVYFAEKNTK